jgi:Thoeris protein ThsA, Macro domain
MGNDLVAQSTVKDLWSSLGLLWDAVSEHGQRASIAMPVVGSELARVDSLDRESLVKMILLAFVARSRERVFCKELVLVVHPKDVTAIDMVEVGSFLRRL